MTFPINIESRRPAAVNSIRLEALYLPDNPLSSDNPDILARYSGRIVLVVVDQDNALMPAIKKDLIAILTQTEKQQLLAILDRLKSVADARINSL